MGLMGACNGWSEADEAGRAKIWEATSNTRWRCITFSAPIPASPKQSARSMQQIGLCKD